jgi:ApaG protein
MTKSKKYEIAITTYPQYLPDQSDPASNKYVFAYTIHLHNLGQSVAQLISRHWVITSAGGIVQQVKGLGVVGRQPIIKPGELFEYTSHCLIYSPVGTMEGVYHMVGGDGTPFDLPIPLFTLSIPRLLH